MSRGNLRFTEAEWKAHCARNDRFKSGVARAGPVLRTLAAGQREWVQTASHKAGPLTPTAAMPVSHGTGTSQEGTAGPAATPPDIPTLTERVKGVAIPLERDVLEVVLEAMQAHTRIGWAARMNTGALKVGKRFVRFGFPGLSDVIGQTRDGVLVAVEVKRPGKKPTEQQQEFLDMVKWWGGISFCATCVGDVIEGLK